MTKKEIALQNYREALIAGGCSENVANYHAYRIRRSSIAEINERVEAVVKSNNYKAAATAREEYYETPEGKAFKEELKVLLDAESENTEKFHQEFVTKVAAALAEMIPLVGSYAVTDISSERLILQPAPNAYSWQIEICWQNAFWREHGENTPTINVAARGSISVKNESKDRDYYINVGILFTKFEELQKIHDKYLTEYETGLKARHEVTDGIRARIKNPLQSEYIH